MGLLNLREISEIMLAMDRKTPDSREFNLTRGKLLRDAMFAYVDAHDERVRIGQGLRSGDEESLAAFDLAVQDEDATLETLRELIRPLQQGWAGRVTKPPQTRAARSRYSATASSPDEAASVS